MVYVYTDDTQMYLAFYPDEGAAAVENMTDCIIEIRDWMETNLLRLNDAKTEFMVLCIPGTLKLNLVRMLDWLRLKKQR